MDPYTFSSLHHRILEPYNYYNFGQRYVASLIDFNNSLLGHPERWAQVASMLKAGENVVLLANHQTEADPGVFAHMLQAGHKISEILLALADCPFLALLHVDRTPSQSLPQTSYM